MKPRDVVLFLVAVFCLFDGVFGALGGCARGVRLDRIEERLSRLEGTRCAR